MLKQDYLNELDLSVIPAAFGRLCVETAAVACLWSTVIQPPSGGCVLKRVCHISPRTWLAPAAFRRLCVETASCAGLMAHDSPASFGRLCAETLVTTNSMTTYSVSRLGVAVCSNIVQAGYSSSVRRKLPAKRDSFMT